MTLRIANYVMIAMFALSAAVQYNDPNPVRWMLIYGAACITSILFAVKRLHWLAGAGIAAIAGIWALLKIPDLTAVGFQHMFEEVQMMNTGVEAAREFLGLIIVCMWGIILAVSVYRGKKGKSL